MWNPKDNIPLLQSLPVEFKQKTFENIPVTFLYIYYIASWEWHKLLCEEDIERKWILYDFIFGVKFFVKPVMGKDALIFDTKCYIDIQNWHYTLDTFIYN